MKEKGALPLPPYIKRDEKDPRAKIDYEAYQTVYSEQEGSLAAPTAGLHFTTELLKRLKDKGVEIVKVVLHVGWGTFKPISKSIDTHTMLPETYSISKETVKILKKAKRENRHICAVGTTSTRVLESLPDDVPEQDTKGSTNLFIRPGHSFRWVSCLITNFHVPRSTPLSLAAAFLGWEKLEVAYGEALSHDYRFFSYGDAMLIQ